MIIFIIREYKPSDLKQLINVYKSAFAEPPWDEYKKCPECGINYGLLEVNQSSLYCKKCNKKINFIEFWSSEDIEKDLEFALSQQNSIVLVAENTDGLEGFSWGYQIPFDKFPFLTCKINSESNYMDEIAVRGNKRKRGIGLRLCKEYINKVRAPEIVLRTDRRNLASMTLFKKSGFLSLDIYDPQYTDRIYLSLILGDKNERN